MRWCGFIRADAFDTVSHSRNAAEAKLSNTQVRLGDRTKELEAAKDFIATKLTLLTDLAPVVDYRSGAQIDWYADPNGAATIFADDLVHGRRRDIVLRLQIPAAIEFWMQHDYAAVDEALQFIGESTAKRITSELRFGLTGSRTRSAA